jgi:signal transduction histidine kinase
VPLGDRAARISLLNNQSIEEVKKGFIAGRNVEEDLDAMIWLFKNFKNIPFFKKAISKWTDADNSIDKLVLLGNEIHQRTLKNEIDLTEKKILLGRINSIAAKLSISQSEFSDALGDGTRAIKNYLLIVNIALTLIILGSVSTYYSVLLTKLKRLTAETNKKNSKLIKANKELDKFVYSASHDLRAPISSLQGLIEVMKLEDDMNQFKIYLNLMGESLTKQDKYIRDIIDYSRNTRKQTTISEVSLSAIIDEALLQHTFTKEADKIKITIDAAIDKINSDELKLKIIINNFLSNAIKYADPEKEEQFFSIRTYRDKNYIKIEFKDNGIGIATKYQDKIFDMFFVTNSDNNGSGLGLYIVKDAVSNLNGTITLASVEKIGTTFTVILPEQYEIQL